MHSPALVKALLFKRHVTTKTLRIMKITAFLLTVICLHAAAGGYSQTITLSIKNASLEKVFVEIKKQTGYEFVYRWELLQNTRLVDIDVKDEPLKQVLDICFRNQRLTYTIMDNQIVLSEKAEQKNISPPLLSLIDITGKITDKDGNPLAGANVKVKGTTNGTTTNAEGEFVLKAIDENAVLEISFVGYETQTIAVKNKTTINTSLAVNTKQLDEMLVQAYGTTTRRLNVGNISKVSAEEISRQPVSNPLAALEGRVPGLIVTQTSGISGAAFKIQLRGQNSIAQGSDPLFVIDGVPFAPNNSNINQLNSQATNNLLPGLSPFNSINPNDIESIEILKDADATAIYGSRGANGVILITTKKGKAGKTNYSANVYSGSSKVARTMSMMNTSQYLQMRHEGFNNDAIVPTVTNAPDLLAWDTTRYTDLKKLLIGGTAHTTDAQASISGGTVNTTFFIGGSYHRETTVYPGDLTDARASMHINLNHLSADKRFSTTLSAIYSSDKNNLLSSDLAGGLTLSPNLPPLYDSLGKLNWQQGGVSFLNPLAYLLQTYTVQTDNLLANSRLSYQLLPGLTIRASLGYNTIWGDEMSIFPKTSLNPINNPISSSQFGNSSQKSWIIEPQIEYFKVFPKGKLDLLIGGTLQEQIGKGTTISASGYSSDALLQSIGGAGSLTGSSSYSKYRYDAIFGRINYNWQDKYLINITGRRDGSSRFGPDRQFANFGSVGSGWIFSNEGFIKQALTFLSFGKLRLSYGTTGNDGIGNYKFLDTWRSTLNPYQGIPGLTPSGLFNPDYSWEENKKFESAIELGFLNDRILFSTSYYRNRSGNQLINYRLPAQTGFTSVVQNFSALIQNSGLEFLLTSKNFNTEEVNWTSSINLTINRNKLISFPNIASSSYSAKYVVGKPLSIIYLYHFLGVDPATGIYQFQDVNSDGTIDTKDYVASGNYAPKFYGGFSNDINYKRLELNVFFEFRKQIGQNYLASLTSTPGMMYNQPTIVLNHWQKPGDVSNIQKLSSNPGSLADNAQFTLPSSDGAYSDASFIRLKNISLSYNLPSNWLQKMHLSNCRIYMLGQNLLTITNYKGADPEAQTFYTLPPLKTIAAGIQFTF
jgi:TonB-linked SusC/RagA family outer membrane protein